MPRIVPGDRIEVDHKGRKCWATVTCVTGTTLHFKPDERWFTWRTCARRDVTQHISKSWSPDRAVVR